MSGRRPVFEGTFTRRGGHVGDEDLYNRQEEDRSYGRGQGEGYPPNRQAQRGGFAEEEGDYEQKFERPKGMRGGGGLEIPQGYGYGWRGRSPSPVPAPPQPPSQQQRYRDESGQARLSSSWGRGTSSDYQDDRERERNRGVERERERYPRDEYSSSRGRDPAFGGGGLGLLQQGQQPPNQVLMVLPGGGAGGLLGNLGTFGGLIPQVFPGGMGFQQQQIAPSPFGLGVGTGASSGGSSSIYGAHIQAGVAPKRNLITIPDNNQRGRGRDRERGRRSDFPQREPPRKRSLERDGGQRVLRDPHPGGGGITLGGGPKRPRLSSSRPSLPGPALDKVKRVDISTGAGNNKRGRGRHSHHSHSNKKKEENKKEPSSTAEGKNKDGDGKERKDSEKKDAESEKKVGEEFETLPTSLLICKICQKTMKDAQSFGSHLTGRAHLSMMRLLEERFAVRSAVLMTESKAAEEEIGIEMERQKRAGMGAGKGGKPDKTAGNYCKMCDCNYTLNWGSHKVSLGHRVLKEFLHPTCRLCSAPFMHRRDWAAHLLSPSHLQKVAELKASDSESELVMEMESPTMDYLFSIFVSLSCEERVATPLSIRPLSSEGHTPFDEDILKEILKNDRGEIALPEGVIKLPEEYNPELMVGGDAVVTVGGARCRVCRLYIPEGKSVDEHCSSREHYNQYVSFIKRVNRHREYKEREKKEKAEREERKKQREKEEEERKLKEKDEKEKKTTENKSAVTTNGEKTEEELGEDEVVILLDSVNGEEEEKKLEESNKVEEIVDPIDVDEDVDDEEDENDEYNEEALLQNDDEMDEEGNVLRDEHEHDGDENMGEEDSAPEVITPEDEAITVPQIVGVTGGVSLPPEEDEEKDVIEEELNEIVQHDEKMEDPSTHTLPSSECNEKSETPPPTTPPPVLRGSPRGRGRPRGGRGAPTPALKTVVAKVDSGIRGRGVRGSGRAFRSNPRGRGRGR